MNTPKEGWSLEQALDLLDQGYSPAHVEHVSGYDARYLQAAAHRTTTPRTPRSTPGGARRAGA